MELEKLEIKGLFGRRDINLKFGKITFLTGVNGSGKSTILNIINAFFSKDIDYFKELKFEKIKFTYKEENEIKPKVISIKKSDFEKNENKLKKIENIYYINDNGIIERNIKKIESYKGKKIDEEELNNLLKENLSPIEKVNGIIEKLLIDKYATMVPAEIIANKLIEIRNFLKEIEWKDDKLFYEIEKIIENVYLEKENYNNLQEIYKKIIINNINVSGIDLILQKILYILQLLSNNEINKKHEIDIILEKINKFFESSWKELRINSKKLEIIDYLTREKTEAKSEKYQSLYKLSSGEKNLIINIISLFYYKKGIYLLDEPENSLHISWQKEFSKLLKEIEKNEKQVIIATHSPDITEEFEKEYFRVLYPYSERENSNV